MKQIRYDVIFLNEMEGTFYAGSFEDAIIRAMYYATLKGWDSNIKFVTDEKGNTIQDIQINYNHAR